MRVTVELRDDRVAIAMNNLVVVVRLWEARHQNPTIYHCNDKQTWSRMMSPDPGGIWPNIQALWPDFSAASSSETRKDKMPFGSGLEGVSSYRLDGGGTKA